MGNCETSPASSNRATNIIYTVCAEQEQPTSPVQIQPEPKLKKSLVSPAGSSGAHSPKCSPRSRKALLSPSCSCTCSRCSPRSRKGSPSPRRSPRSRKESKESPTPSHSPRSPRGQSKRRQRRNDEGRGTVSLTVGGYAKELENEQKVEHRETKSLTIAAFAIHEPLSLPRLLDSKPTSCLTKQGSVASITPKSVVFNAEGYSARPDRQPSAATALVNDSKHGGASKQISKDSLTSRSVEGSRDAPLTPVHRTPARRPTPYYSYEYLDSDPEIAVEAKLPSMALVKGRATADKVHMDGSTGAL